MDDDTIKKYIESSIKILDIVRLNRRVKSDSQMISLSSRKFYSNLRGKYFLNLFTCSKLDTKSSTSFQKLRFVIHVLGLGILVITARDNLDASTMAITNIMTLLFALPRTKRFTA